MPRRKPVKFHEIPFSNVSKAKARRMLEDGTAHGRPLTTKQRGALGARVSDSKPKRRKRGR